MKTLLLAPALLVAAAMLFPGCRHEERRDRRDDRAARAIDERLKPAREAPPREGVAAAILIDVSGSMEDPVEGMDGRSEPKIEIARRAARDLVVLQLAGPEARRHRQRVAVEQHRAAHAAVRDPAVVRREREREARQELRRLEGAHGLRARSPVLDAQRCEVGVLQGDQCRGAIRCETRPAQPDRALGASRTRRRIEPE